MCACGCFLLAAIAAGLFYTVTHGMWAAAVGIVIAAALIGVFGKKAATARSTSQK